MTTLGVFIWAVGLGILSDRLFSLWATTDPAVWTIKKRRIEAAIIFVCVVLIFIGFTVQIMRLK